MSLHKLTAGDGYSYLTRQVAALDATERGHTGLAEYYSQRGESPGQWLGSALGDVDLQDGQEVTAAQMAALFGEGKHPNADAITEQVMDKRAGGSGRVQDVQEAIRLGAPFAVIDSAPAFRVAVANACAQVNAGLGMPHDWPLAAAERARVRTDVGRDMFAREYARPPKDPRELSSFIARHSRAASTAVAGFDLSFTPVKSVSALWAIAPKDVADQIAAATTPPSRTRCLGWNGTRCAPAVAATGCSSWTPPGCSRPRSATATRGPVTPTCTPTSRSPPKSASAPPTALPGGG